MRVLHLSTTDIHGGAGRAAHRIHHALLEAGVDSRMSVQVKFSNEQRVRSPSAGVNRLSAIVRTRLKTAIFTKLVRPSAPFSTQFLPGPSTAYNRRAGADVVHLHWVCDGFLGIGELSRIISPIVWTCHDQWPFTGGCHYSNGCDRFEETCGCCPILGVKTKGDLSRLVHSTKRRRWKNLDISVVSPSRWMAEEAARSSLFRGRNIHVIPYPVDLHKFKPILKERAREQLGMEPSRPTLLFAAMSASTDPRKGFDLLESTLSFLGPELENLQLLIVGASEPIPAQTPARRVCSLGMISDDASLALAYSAADVFVAPSRQDNFPNTVVESLACGTPVAAFRVGGIPEMVEHQRTGFLAEPYDSGQLAYGISELLIKGRLQQLSTDARASAEKLFSPTDIAAKYKEIYRSVLETTSESYGHLNFHAQE